MQPVNLNQAWCQTLLGALQAGGVRHAVVCPGSRSSPLALACATQQGIKTWSVVDERSAAFFALGLAKGSNTPVVVVCTSGTAAAHFLPAAMEAHLTHVPLIFLTADRPMELHGWGALQSLDQQRLFGAYTSRFVDLGAPGWTALEFRHLRATAAQAAATPGVVHLNCPFREPLAPTPQDMSLLEPGALEGASIQLPRPLHHVPQAALEEVAAALSKALRPLIMVGPRDVQDGLPDALYRLAGHAGLPILAEGCSQLRWNAGARNVVSHADAILRDAAAANELRPDVVLKFGGPLTTRGMQTWLDQSGAAIALFHAHGDAFDPNHAASWLLHGDETDAVERLTRLLATRVHGAFGQKWLQTDQAAAKAISLHVANTAGLTEPAIARAVTDALPGGTNLFISSSMPIRDVEALASSNTRDIRTMCNRGAAGIDGIASTALGCAAATGRPTVLLTGDLSFIHDLGGLLTAKRHGIPLHVVLVNNDGGGIFSFLPIAKAQDHFEALFGTPHGLDFSHAAALFGASHARPETVAALKAALLDGLGTSFKIIEARTQRSNNGADHAAVWDAVKAAIRSVP